MGPGILPEITFGKHNPPCHLQMPIKAISCKNEAICEYGPGASLCLSGAKDHLKRTVSKWINVLWSDESKFEILFGNHGRRVLQGKEKGDLPACHQRSVQNPASLMVWGVHKCIWYGQLACFGRHYECWKVYKGFRAAYAPLQMTSISGKVMCITAGQCKTAYCSYYNSMAS